MTITRPGDAAGDDFPALGQIISEKRGVFIINVAHLVRAESTELSALEKSRSFQIHLLFLMSM